jgi:peptide/nickel transport system substrate-binding protein
MVETVWALELRPNVVWQDGVPFAADDVAFTIGRVPHVPNRPGGYAGFVKAITGVEVVDPLLIRFHTAAPYANLPTDLASVSIVSRQIQAFWAARKPLTFDVRTDELTLMMGVHPQR